MMHVMWLLSTNQSAYHYSEISRLSKHESVYKAKHRWVFSKRLRPKKKNCCCVVLFCCKCIAPVRFDFVFVLPHGRLTSTVQLDFYTSKTDTIRLNSYLQVCNLQVCNLHMCVICKFPLPLPICKLFNGVQFWPYFWQLWLSSELNLCHKVHKQEPDHWFIPLKDLTHYLLVELP